MINKNRKKAWFLIEIILLVILIIMAAYMIRGKTKGKKQCITVILHNAYDIQNKSFKYGVEMAAEDNDVDVIFVNDIAGTDPASVDIMNCPKVRNDNAGIGKALADALLEDFSGRPEGKKIGIAAFEGEQEGICERRESFLNEMADSGINVIWDIEADTESRLTEKLMAAVKADIVVTLDDVSTRAAGNYYSTEKKGQSLMYCTGNSMEAVYYLDTDISRCLVVPDEFSLGYESLKETVAKSGREYLAGYSVLRKKNLFNEDNQKLLYVLSR